jgi:hypothetical protein
MQENITKNIGNVQTVEHITTEGSVDIYVMENNWKKYSGCMIDLTIFEHPKAGYEHITESEMKDCQLTVAQTEELIKKLKKAVKYAKECEKGMYVAED